MRGILLKKTAILINVLLCGFIIFASPQADAADAYSRITAKKEIRIGISKHYPPLNFKGGKSGLEMEMARELGKFLGVKVTLVKLPVAVYVSALQKGRVDIILAGFSRNLKRGRIIWFSKPYLSVTPGVLVRKNALPQRRYGDEFEERLISSIWDLKSLTRFSFAAKKGSAYEELLKEHFPNTKRVIITSNDEGIRLLKKGRVKGFVHDSLYLKYLYGTSAKLRSRYRLLQGGAQTEQLCIGLPFGDVVLKNQIDLFVDEMIRTGRIRSWLEKYNTK